MIELLVWRHAKTEPAAAGHSDFARELRPVGRRHARSIGRWIAERGPIPEVVICSASVRTRETADIAIAEFARPPARFDLDELYVADSSDYIPIIAIHGGSATRTLIVAHNPATAQFVSQLAGRSVHMSPGTLAVVEADAPRASELTPRTPLRLRDVITPPGKSRDRY
ncbi:MAG: SixA phosphatase family protein [Spirochaetota bacterium]